MSKRRPAAVKAWEALLQSGASQRQLDGAERLLRQGWVLPMPIVSSNPWIETDGRWCEALVLAVSWLAGPGTPMSWAVLAIPEAAREGEDEDQLFVIPLYLPGTSAADSDSVEDATIRVFLVSGDYLVKRLAEGVPRSLIGDGGVPHGAAAAEPRGHARARPNEDALRDQIQLVEAWKALERISGSSKRDGRHETLEELLWGIGSGQADAGGNGLTEGGDESRGLSAKGLGGMNRLQSMMARNPERRVPDTVVHAALRSATLALRQVRDTSAHVGHAREFSLACSPAGLGTAGHAHHTVLKGMRAEPTAWWLVEGGMATYRAAKQQRERPGQFRSFTPIRAGYGGPSLEGPKGAGRCPQEVRSRGRRNKATHWRFLGPGAAQSKGKGKGRSGPGRSNYIDHINDINVDDDIEQMSLAELVSELLNEVRRTGVPKASSSREAVLRAGEAAPNITRSCLFGLYTKIGMGLSSSTTRPRWFRALQLIHALGRRRDPDLRHDYCAVMLNHNTEVAPHADRFNTGASSLLSFGRHHGGQLWIEDSQGDHVLDIAGERVHGRALESRGRWQCFEAQTRHCVLPARAEEGADSDDIERFSISLFSPGRLHDVPSNLWLRLQQLGFPVASLMVADEGSQASPAAQHFHADAEPVASLSNESGHSSRTRGRRGRRKAPLSLTGAVVGALSASPARSHPVSAPTMEPSPPTFSRSSASQRRPLHAKMTYPNSLETLWQQLRRLKMPSRFLEFLRQGHALAARGEEPPSLDEESSVVLPCGLPYLTQVRGSAPSSGRRRARWHRAHHRRQWIDASIAYLNWLFLGKPSGPGLKWASVLVTPLTSAQWALVARLEHTYQAVCRLGEESPDLPSGGLASLA
eukprot:5290002-Amphidinium_carterae.2